MTASSGNAAIFYGGLLLWIAIVILCATAGRRRRARRMKGEDLQEVALALSGELERRGEGSFPGLRFRRRGLPCHFYRWFSSASDQVVSNFEAGIGCEDYLDAVSRPMETGGPRFAKAEEMDPSNPLFRIVCGDTELGSFLMAHGLGDLLVDSLNLAKAPIAVQFTPTRLTLVVSSCLAPGQIIDLAHHLGEYIRLLEDRALAVGVMMSEPMSSRCAVCGGSLEAAIVRCDLCAMPHHLECWEYIGRCATFGCRSRRAA